MFLIKKILDFLRKDKAYLESVEVLIESQKEHIEALEQLLDAKNKYAVGLQDEIKHHRQILSDFQIRVVALTKTLVIIKVLALQDQSKEVIEAVNTVLSEREFKELYSKIITSK